MDTIIQKASNGDRTALTQPYEGNKQEVFFLCRALLRNSTATIPAAKWAFKLPPQKNFRIGHVNEHYIDPEAEMVDNYINCLPAAQRFALVLRIIGTMFANQIARMIGLDAGCADLWYHRQSCCT